MVSIRLLGDDPLNWHLLPDGREAKGTRTSVLSHAATVPKQPTPRELPSSEIVQGCDLQDPVELDGVPSVLPPLCFAEAAREKLDAVLLLRADLDVDAVLSLATRTTQWGLLKTALLWRSVGYQILSVIESL